MTGKARSERILRHLESANKAHPLELAKYSLERAGASSSEMEINNDFAECALLEGYQAVAKAAVDHEDCGRNL